MTFVIAEAGINHNGNIDIAKRLADTAKQCGADAVKFQTFWNITRLEKYELTKPEWIELKEYCDNIGIKFLSTPHTMDAIHFVDTLVDIHKLASPFIFYHNFLIEIAKKNKPILMSTGNYVSDTGMATLDEISNAIKVIESYTPIRDNITLLHCVSKYPLNDSHLERIDELKTLGRPIGLSDHSKSTDIPIRFPIIEKHFMLDDVESIDENVSLKPQEFKFMVDKLRKSYD
jgi:N,N'-diacetyllegionaminate synthase